VNGGSETKTVLKDTFVHLANAGRRTKALVELALGQSVCRNPDIGTSFGAARLTVAGLPPEEFAQMSAEAYRRNAADCLRISLAVADPEARAFLKQMAIAWTNLADQAEKNLRNGMVYEPPLSIVQQQPQPKGLDLDVLTPEEQRKVLDG